MIRVLLPLFIIIIATVSFIHYEYPSAFKSLYTQRLINTKMWGKIEVVEERPISSLKDVFQSELVWQILEQLVGFVAGVLICVLIGWRVSSCRNIYEKSFENSLTECLQRQYRFEKQLSALELQIIDFERTYLFTNKDTTTCDSCHTSPAITGQAGHVTNEQVDESYKDDRNIKNEVMVRRAVEVIMKHDFDESNFECILEKLTKILERLSKLSKEKNGPVLDSNIVSVQEQDPEIENTDVKECYKNEILEVENEICEIEEASETINEEEDKNEFCPEEVEGKTYSYSDVSRENYPHELQLCKSKEKLSNTISNVGDGEYEETFRGKIVPVGSGEFEDTFRGKIVPVSQIPKYHDFRRSQKQKGKAHKEYDDEKLVSYITSSNTPEPVTPERCTPQSSPRKHNSAPIENGVDRGTSRGGRKKQRS